MQDRSIKPSVAGKCLMRGVVSQAENTNTASSLDYRTRDCSTIIMQTYTTVYGTTTVYARSITLQVCC